VPLRGERRLAVGGREVAVAARHGQAVRLAHRRDGDDVDPEVEVGDHPPDEQQLLGVLLPEQRNLSAGQVQQLADHGEDAVEVAWSRLPLEHVAERAGIHPDGGVAVRVHLVGGGCEDQVDALALAELQVGVEGARVPRQVFARPELQRVEEQRHDDDGRTLAGLPHQGRVPLVQRPESHDHRDIAAAERGPASRQLGTGADDERPAQAV
jgi:hypothetical protein